MFGNWDRTAVITLWQHVYIHLWTIEKVEKQTNQAVYTSAVPAAKSWCTGLMSQVFISLEQIESTSIV